MLDKSLDFKDLIMRIEADKLQNMQPPILPEGYSFRLFTTGGEADWARIETSVDEFESMGSAQAYFEQAYLPHRQEVEKRCLFVLNPEGFPIGTALSWYADSALGHQALLNWVAVCPDYQGLGLGRAIVQQALINFRTLEPDQPVWLHTQTWSPPAIKLYHQLGFCLMKTAKLANMNSRSGVPKIYENQYEDGIAILKKVMDAHTVEQMIAKAI